MPDVLKGVRGGEGLELRGDDPAARSASTAAMTSDRGGKRANRRLIWSSCRPLRAPAVLT